MALLNQAKGATQAPGGGQYSYVNGDAVVKAQVHFLSKVAPVLFPNDGGTGPLVTNPADAFYFDIGRDTGSSLVWAGMASGGGMAVQQWDSTAEQFYCRLGATSSSSVGTSTAGTSQGGRIIYPRGLGGLATDSAPKPVGSPTKVILSGKWRFTQNADYNTDGVGAATVATGTGFNGTGAGGSFNICPDGAGHWKLYTNDGTTRSSSTGGTSDTTTLHEFQIIWTLEGTPTITLYVDDVATITKTTNLPTQPLSVYAQSVGTNKIDMVDISVRWE